MPTWYVEYRRPDGTVGGMQLPATAGRTAAEVHAKVESGEVPELYVPRGGVVSVRRVES